MEIKSIKRGIVIDHITAGAGMKILEYLNVDLKENSVAFLMNAVSEKHGRKDVIKLENIRDIDLTALGLIDHNATVNVIENHRIVEKIKLKLPKTVENVIKCKNPRCVTSIETGVPHIFYLLDSEMEEYSCKYCDDIVQID